jgi:hypothetical protein
LFVMVGRRRRGVNGITDVACGCAADGRALCDGKPFLPQVARTHLDELRLHAGAGELVAEPPTRFR